MPAKSHPIQITVRVDEEEKHMIERRAEAAGLSVSRYLAERGTSDEALRPIESRDEEAEALRDLYDQIKGIGTNVNQIARHANRQQRADPDGVKAAAKAAEQAADRILDELASIYEGR